MSGEAKLELKRKSIAAALLASIGVGVVFLSFVYAYIVLGDLQKDIDGKKADILKSEESIRVLIEKIENLKIEVLEKEKSIGTLDARVVSLTKTQEDVLDFLALVVDSENISILDQSVDWNKVKGDVIGIESATRRRVVFTAILLAWKDIPFSLGKNSLRKGFDSPGFIEYVLSKNGIRIERRKGELLSSAIMRQCERVEKPLPGDLVFYKGQVGSFGFFYISDGAGSTNGIGVGTLQKISPLQILDLDHVNTPFFPRIGYFRPPYDTTN